MLTGWCLSCYPFRVTTCLLAIDLIEDCLAHLPHAQVEGIVAATNELVALFRLKALPVVWVRQEFAPDLSDAFLEMRKRGIRSSISGTTGARLDPRLDCRASDLTIIKKRYSAFFRTNLDEVLTELGAQELVLVGVNTHACIRTAAIDAYQRDLEVILASECMGSWDEEHARISLRYMDGKIGRALTNAEIHKHLEACERDVR